jgi:L-fuconolactonase
MTTGIVDSHQHFWQVGRFAYPWMTDDVEVLCQDYLPRALEPILRRCGVEKTILVQASNSVEETRWLLNLSDQYPFIAGVVGWVDLSGREVGHQLSEFIAHPKFKGVRHLVESEPADDWLIQPEVINGLRRVASYNLSYDLLVHTRHLKHVRTVAESCPELSLVVDHLAKPPIANGEISDWAGAIKEVAANPNVSCKLSGLVTEASWTNWRIEDLKRFVDTALECFGPQRLMFGSDWPVCLRAASYDRVLEAFQSLLADLNEQERRCIFSGNATEFYRLQGQARAGSDHSKNSLSLWERAGVRE